MKRGKKGILLTLLLVILTLIEGVSGPLLSYAADYQMDERYSADRAVVNSFQKDNFGSKPMPTPDPTKVYMIGKPGRNYGKPGDYTGPAKLFYSVYCEVTSHYIFWQNYIPFTYKSKAILPQYEEKNFQARSREDGTFNKCINQSEDRATGRSILMASAVLHTASLTAATMNGNYEPYDACVKRRAIRSGDSTDYPNGGPVGTVVNHVYTNASSLSWARENKFNPQKYLGERDGYQFDCHYYRFYQIVELTPKKKGEQDLSCKYEVTAPQVSENRFMGVLSPSSRDGKIAADGAFDVGQGIPTSEDLNVRASGDRYIYKYKWDRMTGNVQYTVTIKYQVVKEWTKVETVQVVDPVTKKVTKKEVEYPQKEIGPTETKTIVVERPYSYWVVNDLQLYNLESMIVKNYALPGGAVTLNGTTINYNVNASSDVDDHVTIGACIREYEVPSNLTTFKSTVKNQPPAVELPEFKELVEPKFGKTKVKNDLVEFEGQTIMSDAQSEERTNAPGRIPDAGTHSDSRSALTIPSYLRNAANTAGDVEFIYAQLYSTNEGPEEYRFDKSINTVTVHTPTVIKGDTTDGRQYNERVEPEVGRKALILDQAFVVYTPTVGQHLNIPGYGNRDYSKYVRATEVKFPFDVFKTDNTFVKRGEWVTLAKGVAAQQFILPVWVAEGNYNIEVRAIAENAPADATGQPNANLNLANHIATDVIPVNVVGRLYDFRVTDIADFNWESVFRTGRGLPTHTGKYYWVGTDGINGAPRGINSQMTLPIRPGSHTNPAYRNVAVKTGYHFKFAVKTMGDMWGNKDGIRITPSFYYVNRLGNLVATPREKVDLYYLNEKKNLVKIGSDADKQYRSVVLNSRLRNVNLDELQAAGEYIYRHKENYPSYQTSNVFQGTFVDKFVNQYSKKATVAGTYSWMILNHELRTLIGPSADEIPEGASIPASDGRSRIQQWYGEYSIPADVYPVKAGTDVAAYARKNGGVSKRSPIFLKDGYIVVNFNIETIRDGNLDKPYLRYYNVPLAQQWGIEGFKTSFTDGSGRWFTGQYGDVIWYHTNESSYGDFKSMVTH